MDDKQVDAILEFIKINWEKNNLNTLYPNKLLRNDVLKLLDEYCTIVYYPLNDHINNGFHTEIPDKNGVDQHFVFINTSQTIEKQVFTAAHELGHIWGVDEFVCEQCNVPENDDAAREKIINRFAAELLMPKEFFLQATYRGVRKYFQNPRKASIKNFFQLVAMLMNLFFVPSAAIILRFAELDIMQQDIAADLIDRLKAPNSLLLKTQEQILRDLGFTEFLIADQRKWIEGLPELLQKAELVGKISQEKINKVRNDFGILPKQSTWDTDETVEIRQFV